MRSLLEILSGNKDNMFSTNLWRKRSNRRGEHAERQLVSSVMMVYARLFISLKIACCAFLCSANDFEERTKRRQHLSLCFDEIYFQFDVRMMDRRLTSDHFQCQSISSAVNQFVIRSGVDIDWIRGNSILNDEEKQRRE